ncbi:zinc-dependent alcohol dehydrogenase family protein [Lacisediminihabitans sp. G11-30]|uniref:alcohol dehydrogenase n=2 Tax=Lacisediminihabitans changchengi TaxID=2787634 RepID=A0A934SU71_9MICO|nr:zinc-dependent alcohol dehydrogenase family protein [Lacisediminihabitans changchengi]
MRAWLSNLGTGTVELSTVPMPDPEPGEVQVKVLACGVCRTDLHVVDGELPVHRPRVIPGHQVVGTVSAIGSSVTSLAVGDLVGAAWLRSSCGDCEWCRSGRENLCPFSTYTGWDADGGYAEYLTVPAAFAYSLADGTDPVATAPLLCAGIIGYRALQRSALPPGGNLGLYGFGSSAHLTAQIAQAAGARIFAITRGEANQNLARTLGAAFVGGEEATPPEPLDSAIIFAPAGPIVPQALAATKRGGTVVTAGIHMSDIPAMNYDHDLFNERDLRSVTANTRADGAAFLRIAHTLALVPEVTVYPFDKVDRALSDLRAGRASGSLVVVMP